MSSPLYAVATASFEAACRLESLPAHHPARALHGHSYLAQLRCRYPDHSDPEALRQQLQQAVTPLDYCDLNRVIAEPSDENIARWLHTQLKPLQPQQIGIQSVATQGVDLDSQESAHIWHRFRFEAAHQLPNVPPGHPCGRMHGHGFEVILHLQQPLHGAIMGYDYRQLQQLWQPLHQQLHQRCLNDIAGLENPTSEQLCRWIWRQLKPKLPLLSWVTSYETHSSGCHYNGEQYHIWKELRFESALKRAVAGQPRLYGHSYRIRLHLTAPLDAVLGWTVDYGEVKQLFQPIYQQLDHQLLNQQLAEPSLPNLLYHIEAALVPRLPQLSRIDLLQTPEIGAVLQRETGEPVVPV
ncbi:6-pyruvoyl tetrahydropterin synthase [Ectothiorhodospiraceae bacterium BW-2]|nr:6-pyruvoyl tetrahydropterin synthase [Ectothiorhodospiraceae bacterium BW-2]